jgi:hypothetical protein
MNEKELSINSRVELIPGMDQVYRKATGGSLGTVKERKVDDDGFPMIFVEWDKADWHYAGEKDGWVFESHFRPATKESELSPEDILAKALEQVEDDHFDEEEAEEQIERFINSINQATEALMDGDGFMLISVRRISSNSGIALVPIVLGDAIDAETRTLIEAQLLQIAASIHSETAMEMFKHIMRKKNEDDGEDGWETSGSQ